VDTLFALFWALWDTNLVRVPGRYIASRVLCDLDVVLFYESSALEYAEILLCRKQVDLHTELKHLMAFIFWEKVYARRGYLPISVETWVRWGEKRWTEKERIRHRAGPDEHPMFYAEYFRTDPRRFKDVWRTL